jgi:hypothetical protein
MKKLSAFFYYYGAKNSLATLYPPPEYRTIIEPFAGSAAYSLAYAHHDVQLYDMDERLCGVWDYLIRTPEIEILNLPNLPAEASVDELPVCQEARWLIGYCLGQASGQGPQARWTTWALNKWRGGVAPSDAWSKQCRHKIARQQRFIRHWRIHHKPWTAAPVRREATYFVDPPYQVAGKHYRCGADGVDFRALAAWCRTSPGQVIACEAAGADWLPFAPFRTIASQGRVGERKGHGKSREVMWTNRRKVLVGTEVRYVPMEAAE